MIESSLSQGMYSERSFPKHVECTGALAAVMPCCAFGTASRADRSHACMHAGLIATPAATEEPSEEAVAAIPQTLQPVVSLFPVRSGTAVNFLLHYVPLLSMQSFSLPHSLRLALFACATTVECGTMQ